jgi:tetratricopeptide (TPR) repeat protein
MLLRDILIVSQKLLFGLEKKMNDLITKIINVSLDKDASAKIEKLLEERLIIEPCNIELWLRLALVEIQVPLVDCDKAIACLDKVFALEKDNPIALLFLAFIYHYELGGVEQDLSDRLDSINTLDEEVNSMLKYTASWLHYKYTWIYKDLKYKERAKELLKESIAIYGGHVWNYVNLAKIYFLEKKDEEAKKLIEKALKNVIKIYVFPSNVVREKDDVTDLNEFLNERFKGIYLTDSNYQRIEKLKEGGQ